MLITQLQNFDCKWNLIAKLLWLVTVTIQDRNILTNENAYVHYPKSNLQNFKEKRSIPRRHRAQIEHT